MRKYILRNVETGKYMKFSGSDGEKNKASQFSDGMLNSVYRYAKKGYVVEVIEELDFISHAELIELTRIRNGLKNN